MRRVVDTNVPIVANGRETNATVACQQACLDALQGVLEKGRIVIDDAGEMLTEYQRYLHPRGQPGVGDRFLLEILNFTGKVDRIPLERGADGAYADFPSDKRLKNFDLDDRKFAAASRKVGIPVMNATDTDWLDYRAPLAENGIEVEFVCGCNREEWFV